MVGGGQGLPLTIDLSICKSLHQVHLSALAFLGTQQKTVLQNRLLEPVIDFASNPHLRPCLPRYPGSTSAPKSILGASDRLCIKSTSPAVPSLVSSLKLCSQIDSWTLRSILHKFHVSGRAFIGIQFQTVLPNRFLGPQIDLASNPPLRPFLPRYPGSSCVPKSTLGNSW